MHRTSRAFVHFLSGALLALITLAQGLVPLHTLAGQRGGLTVEICGALGRYEVILPAGGSDDPGLHDADHCLGLCAVAGLPPGAEPFGSLPYSCALAGPWPVISHSRCGRRRSNRPRDPPGA